VTADTEPEARNVFRYLMDVGDEFQALDLRLREIEARLSRLEQPAASARSEAETQLPAAIDGPAPLIDLALAGKSILILGGAFLLRAATESATLPKAAGVTLGLSYAAAWIVVAVFAARAGRRTASVFGAAAASAIAYPIVWEATTRFGVLTAQSAAAILALFSIALIVAGRLYSMQWLAWIAATGATVDALLLAYATNELEPFLIELTVVGGGALLVSMKYVAWLLAIESDLFAVLLIALTLFNDKKPFAVAWLLLFAVVWLSKPGIHAVSGALVGFGGAAAILLQRGAPATAIAIAELIAAAVLYFFAFRRDETYDSIAASIAALCGTLLILPPLFRAIAWGIAAVAAAEIARRRSSIAFSIQSVVWGAVAAIGSFVIAVPFCFVAFLRRRNLVLLAIAAAGATFAITRDLTPLLRTVVLAVASLALAICGYKWRMREASQLAIAGLIVTGVQVVAEIFRNGTAVMMFVALAVYGGAMLGIARLRKTSIAVSYAEK
jgi:hypothetical protein